MQTTNVARPFASPSASIRIDDPMDNIPKLLTGSYCCPGLVSEWIIRGHMTGQGFERRPLFDKLNQIFRKFLNFRGIVSVAC